MQPEPPRSAKRTFTAYFGTRLVAVLATSGRISSTLAIVALVSLLALWSILMAVSRDNEAHAQIVASDNWLALQLSPQRDSVFTTESDLPRSKLGRVFHRTPVEEGQTLRILVQG